MNKNKLAIDLIQENQFSSIKWLTEQAVKKHKENKIEEAIAYYLEIIESNEKVVDWIYENTITLMAKENKYIDALELGNKALKNYPKSSSVYRAIGVVYSQSQDEENSFLSYYQAYKLDKNQPEWLYSKLLSKLLHQQEYEKAIEIGIDGFGLHQNSFYISLYTGDALSETGQYIEAISYYEKIKLIPDNSAISISDIENKIINLYEKSKQSNQIIRISNKIEAYITDKENNDIYDKTTLFFYPNYTETNPYQDLLYSDADHNTKIYPGDIDIALVEATKKNNHKVIFHLHWTTPILSNANNEQEARYYLNEYINKILNFIFEGGALLWTIHNTLPHDCKFPEQEISLRKNLACLASKIHIHSKKSIPEIETLFVLPKNKVHVIHHGNYVTENQNYVPRKVARKKFGFTSENIVFLFLGQIRPYKGIDLLLYAFSKLQKKYSQAYLLIAGEPKLPIANNQIYNTSKLFDNIIVHEKRLNDDELQWYFNSCDFVVLPYKKILTSGSVFNALSFSRPVIVPKVAMLEEIIQDDYNGFLYELNSVSSLYEAMERAISISADKRQLLFEQSLDSIKQYTWQDTCKKLTSGIKPIVNKIQLSIETESVTCRIWNPIDKIVEKDTVAIIILNYGCVEDTNRLVTSIQSSIYKKFKIIIVDNNSPNYDFKQLIDNFAEYTIIRTSENLGYAAGNNVAIKYIENYDFGYTWILNPDTEIESNSLNELVNAAKDNREISLFGSIICWGHRPDTIWFAGGQIEKKGKGMYISHMYDGEDVNHVPDSIYEVDYITGASIFCTTKTLKEIGLIPEKYFLYFEETDWCLQSKSQGHKIAVVPSCKIYHYKRSQIGILPQKYYFYYYIRGSILFMLKYYSEDIELVQNSIYHKFINPWLKKISKKAPNKYEYFKALAQKAVEHGISKVTGKVNLYRIFEDDYLSSNIHNIVKGYIEVINRDKISGWVMNTSQPLESLEVTIHIDGKEYCKVLADEYSQELKDREFGTGQYKFTISFPDYLCGDRLVHKIEAFVGDYSLECNCDNEVSFDNLPPKYKGRIDGIDYLQIKGWALDVNNLSRELDIEILDGDNVVVQTKTNITRSDLIKAGYNTSVGGFCIPIPVQYCDGNRHNLSLRIVGENNKLSSRDILTSTDKYPKIKAKSIGEFWEWLYYYRAISMIHKQNRECIYLQQTIENAEIIAQKFQDRDQEYLVSIVMPAYNRENIILNAIRSVVNQTYTNWELLVADDGSTDKTIEVVQKYIDDYSETRIKIIKSQENQGVSVARNKALLASTGDLIAYLDSDNTWDQDFLLIMLNMLVDNQWAKLAYCGDKIWQFYPQNTTLDSSAEIVSIRLGHFNQSLIENRNYIDLNVFVHWKEVYKELGGFREDMRRLVDWELIARYTHVYRPKFVPALLANYFMSLCGNQITKVENYQESLIKIQETLKNL